MSTAYVWGKTIATDSSTVVTLQNGDTVSVSGFTSGNGYVQYADMDVLGTVTITSTDSSLITVGDVSKSNNSGLVLSANANLILDGLRITFVGGVSQESNDNTPNTTITLKNNAYMTVKSAISQTTIDFDGGNSTSTLEIDSSATKTTLIYKVTNFTQGDRLDFRNISTLKYLYVIRNSDGTVSLAGDNGNSASKYILVQNFNVANNGSAFAAAYAAALKADGNSGTTNLNKWLTTYMPVTSDGSGGIYVCYLKGSMIGTPNGDVPVEDIRVGDEVYIYAQDGSVSGVRRVIWAGRQMAQARPQLPDDEAGWPVRILKDAISDGVPYKDMLITSEHNLFFDGKFVPVRMLVNGRSIFYDKSIASYEYYHIETEAHSVIKADGMFTESYLDTGNRRAFLQPGPVVSIAPSRNLTWADAAVPLDVSRDFVEPLFRQIEARAEATNHAMQSEDAVLTHETNLVLVTDTGAVIRRIRQNNDRVMFMIPAEVQSVRISSNASRPSDVIGPFVDDRRYFGVAVGDITIFEGNKSQSLTAHLTEKNLDGWNALECGSTRWTTGNALMPLGVRASNSVALLSIQIAAGGPFLASGATNASYALEA